jgi:uncharacterized protein (UPF0303 family)
MPGASPDNIDRAVRKRATTKRFHRSSLAMRHINMLYAIAAGRKLAATKDLR